MTTETKASSESKTDAECVPWWHTASLPVLLGEARRAYGQRIRMLLGDVGMSDMPRQGARVVSGIDRNGVNARDVAGELGISKQAVSKLVDTLVELDYVERVPDPDDRRLVTIGLTSRGRAAAKLVRKAVDQVDAELALRIGADRVFGFRAALANLLGIARDDREKSAAEDD